MVYINVRMLSQRLHDEREAKLRSVTASISRSHAQKTAPIRHTKIAYANSVAKPPREVLRRQMKHRTEMQQLAAVTGKRTAAAALLTGNTASPKKLHSTASPKKRHSTPATLSSPSHTEASQLKGVCVYVCVCVCGVNK